MEVEAIPTQDRIPPKDRGRSSYSKRLWQRMRGPLAQSRVVKNLMATAIALASRFIATTNPYVAQSHRPEGYLSRERPVILALWHGQHLLAPATKPKDVEVVALFSRSADAELNALVAEKLGFEVVRGSGGRQGHVVDKGGARALIALKRSLDAGKTACMIADIPHGTPREAGMGIITLAKISGQPILPAALATSRRKVLARSWDKTTINLPFGRAAMVFGQPVNVPADASPELLEMKRAEVTKLLNDVTERAYRMVDAV